MGVMVVEVELIQLVSTYGLSIAIAVYLVWWITNKLTDKLDNLAEKIDKLNENILKLLDCINKREK